MGIGDLKRAFAAAVRCQRNKLGISQEELAGRANLHRTYICDVEGGGRNVSLETIESIARVLEVPVPALFSADAGAASVRKPSGKFSGATRIADILFVEDDGDDVELTMEALQKARIANRVHVVRDGAAALDFLFGSGKGAHSQSRELPQLILLDLNLPKVDGLQVLRRIKSNPNTRDIPVVVLTASRQDEDFVASRQLGADAYIVKPVDFQSLSQVTPQLKLYWALLRATGSERQDASTTINS